jgi:ABC-type uncharacterized transport system ATPase subunit
MNRGDNQRPTPLLEVRGIVKRFGGVAALDGLSLTLGAGDLNCIIGPNGCGKTTLFNVITGAFLPDEGRVSFRGQDIIGMAPHRIAALGITRKFQIPGVYPDLAVAENLEIPLATAGERRSPLALVRHPTDRRRLKELLEFSALTGKASTTVSELAHGEKQWLEIAMLLATNAELILLDEPTAGMSVVETQRTAELVKTLRDEHGKTVLVIEHDMNFVRLLDCPVVVMMRGRVVREGKYADISNDPEVIGAYLGSGVGVEG